MVKRHADIHAVDVFFKIKQVNFELITHTVDSRAFADIRNALNITQLGRAHGHRVHATQWNCRPVQSNIGRWESNRASAFVSMRDAPTNSVGFAEHAFGIGQAIIQQGLANTCAADAHIIHAVGG